MPRIVDLGAGIDPDRRATETVDLHAPADHQFDLSGPWPLDDASIDGLVATHVVEHLDAEHVFAEAGRVLVDGGWLEVAVPLGENADTDPDHRTRWTYGTPAVFCRQYSAAAGRHWDPDPPFELEERRVDVNLGGPLQRLSPAFRLLARAYPAWCARRCYSGELTARYTRCSRC